jgi:N-acetylglucosamine-6-sulfatase
VPAHPSPRASRLLHCVCSWLVCSSPRRDRTLGREDYTHLGSLEIMPTVRRELIDKGAFLQNFFVNTPICCPSRTEFFSGRYYHNIGPPNEQGGCMHCDTENAVYPLTSLFGLLTRAGYHTGVFGKVTNDQSKILPLATKWSSMEYIDSPLKYNNYMGTTYFRKWPNGTQVMEEIDPENPASCAGVADCLPYQTSQIGNRTQRWLEEVLGGPKPVFAYLGPHAPHYPAQPAPWYNTSFLDPLVTIPITPNWNLSSPSKAQHVRQNPAFTEAVHCWENQHFRDRWRTLLSVDDLVGMVVDTFTKAGKIDDTYIFYSSVSEDEILFTVMYLRHL